MKNFIEKWKQDSKFKAKVQLGLYLIFIVFVSIIAISGYPDTPTNTTNINNNDNDNNINETTNITIDIPEKYSYTKKIIINQKEYQYTGTKNTQKETITKLVDDTTTNYIYENNNYYKNESETYILTTKEDVYDIVGYNYLQLNTINQYLAASTKEDEKYIVYLKDIILGNDSEEYITITKNENKINVNYTSLMKIFDETIENYTFEVIIEEIE